MRLQFRSFHGPERTRWAQKGGAIVIDEPLAETPASTSGLHRGDIIVRFEGNPVQEPGAMVRLLNRACIGRACTLAYVRDGELREIEIVPRERSEKPREDTSA